MDDLVEKIMCDRNLITRQVSILTGVSKSAINRIVNGKTSPSANTLERLAKGLSIRISDLIDSPYK